MSFEFAAPARILFGEGTLRQAGTLAAGLGTRALVVEGSGGRAEPLLELLRTSGVDAARLCVSGEPTIRSVEQAVERARAERCDLVVALGGGSVIDTGKAVAALLTNPGELRDYLEVVGRGQSLRERAAPCIAIPTTAGSGAEVTRNAVVSAEAERVKVSLRSPLMLPTLALVDPELTHSLPPALTASTGLDALTQCIEPFVAPQANPLTDAVAREGIQRAARALRRAYRDGTDAGARHDMAVAGLCGGLALANARLGAVHGFASPLGALVPIPHGTACARLLPAVVRANLHALRARAPASPALERYQEVARLLTGNPTAAPEEAAGWLAALADELEVPGLSVFGVAEADLPAVAENARHASSMQGNPIALTGDELMGILRTAL